MRIGLRQLLEGIDAVAAQVIVPAVLADQEADPHALDGQHAGGLGTGLEMAAIIEDAIHRQQLLVIFGHDAAFAHRQQGIEERLARTGIAARRADDGRQSGQAAGGIDDRLQALFGLRQEAHFFQQIAGVVPADGEFGKDHQVGTGPGGALQAIEVQCQVAGEVTDGGVALGDGDAKHDASFLPPQRLRQGWPARRCRTAGAGRPGKFHPCTKSCPANRTAWPRPGHCRTTAS